jgi:hypothetical protein
LVDDMVLFQLPHRLLLTSDFLLWSLLYPG